MKIFQKLLSQAVHVAGGEAELQKTLEKPRSVAWLRKLPDERWLSELSRAVFRAGFNWDIVDHKWPQIDQALDGFKVSQLAAYTDTKIDQLMQDSRVIRNEAKLLAIRHNAQYLCQLADVHGTAAKYFADYPADAFMQLMDELKKDGRWLGGTAVQHSFRDVGKESIVLDQVLVDALIREKIIDRSPQTKREMALIQNAFNTWVKQGGKNLTRVCGVLVAAGKHQRIGSTR